MLSAENADHLVNVLTLPSAGADSIAAVKDSASSIKTMLENPKSSAIVQSVVDHIMDGKTKPSDADLTSASTNNDIAGILSGLSSQGITTLKNVLSSITDATATTIDSLIANLTKVVTATP